MLLKLIIWILNLIIYIFFEVAGEEIDIIANNGNNMHAFAVKSGKAGYVNNTNKFTLLNNGFRYSNGTATGVTYH